MKLPLNKKVPIPYIDPFDHQLKISEIRGVESESSIKTLESRGLIDNAGELDVPGKPILYKTTDLFLEKIDIENLDNLPLIGEYFASPNEEE